MKKYLLATTAAVSILAAPVAFAQDGNNTGAMDNNRIFSQEPYAGEAPAGGFYSANSDQILATRFIGAYIYNGTGDNAETVGDVNDIIMTPDGRAVAVIAGVGGFLGIGEKEVAVSIDQLAWKTDANGDQVLVGEFSKENLENAPAFDREALMVNRQAAELPADKTMQGDKTAVDELLTNPTVKSVSFVGSTPIAQYVYSTGTAAGKRVQALGGAKNHAVILPDADLDLAADAMVNAGFGSAGERCMAISAAVAVGPIADDLVAKIAKRAATIKTGDGTKDSDMGPLVTQAHRDKVASYIDAGETDGAKVVLDGRQVTPDGGQDGFWLGPTLLDNVTPAMSVYTDEIFGPVLSVVRVDTYDEALELINTNPYGNGTAIFTNDGGAARRFQNEVQVGMVGINVPIPVPMAYYSFGGWKNSLFGDSHAHGMDGVQFFTRQKAITTRWLDPSHGGLNLGFPTN